MIRPLISPRLEAFLRVIVGGFLLMVAATGCDGDKLGPADPIEAPAAAPADSTATPPSDSTLIPTDTITLMPPADSPDGLITQYQGIVFGVSEMPKEFFTSVYNGTAPGGQLDPSNMLTLLSTARAKGARVVIKLCMGRDMWVQNADKTFSLTKWKALVDRYRKVNFSSYIADGTITGHYLIDEPSRPEKWGGKVISQSTIEAMAAYSKSIWPTLPTMVRVVPSWLAKAPITYTKLDAAWFQYASRFGNPATALAAEVVWAKKLGLALMASMNVLDGGNGSSKIPGTITGKWAMSATEVRNYGTALLSNTYICGFHTWMWKPTYYNRSDIKSAMTALSTKAKAHYRVLCR